MKYKRYDFKVTVRIKPCLIHLVNSQASIAECQSESLSRRRLRDDQQRKPFFPCSNFSWKVRQFPLDDDICRGEGIRLIFNVSKNEFYWYLTKRKFRRCQIDTKSLKRKNGQMFLEFGKFKTYSQIFRYSYLIIFHKDVNHIKN